MRLWPENLRRAAAAAVLSGMVMSAALGFVLGRVQRQGRARAPSRWPADPGPREAEPPDLKRFPIISAPPPRPERLPRGVALEGGRLIRVKDRAEMVHVPGSRFRMGTDEAKLRGPSGILDTRRRWRLTEAHVADQMPQHEVYVSAFLMDKYEVTNRQFAAFVAATGYETDAERRGFSHVNVGRRGEKTQGLWRLEEGAYWRRPVGKAQEEAPLPPDHPVLHISWNDAQAYARWAGARLPTEAEWEKAARGVDGRDYPWGDWAHTLVTNRCGAGVRGSEWIGWRTTPVGLHKLARSPYGTYDQAGNVWEWVHDYYHRHYYFESPPKDPAGPERGHLRVLRGGSFNNCFEGFFERCATRFAAAPDMCRDDFGFRLAVSVLSAGSSGEGRRADS